MNRSIFCLIFLLGLFINTICWGQGKLVFLVAGQSNAVGKGDAATSDSADQNMAFEYKYKTNSIVPLKDPVGENALAFGVAHTGSAWPAFARQLIKYKKQQVIIIPAARDGSSCYAGAELKGDGTWAPNGKLFKNSILKTNAALKLTHAGLSGIIWSQGERDANAINAGVLNADEYEQSLRETIARFRAAFTANIPFYIIETGYYKGHPQRGPDLVRKAQEHIAATYPKVYIVYHDANLFTDAEKLPDGIHYNQQSLNKIGAETARKIFKINNPSFNVAGIFTDNMVLQHGIPVAVWGTAFAGLRITACINHKVVSAVTGKINISLSGKWFYNTNIEPKLPKGKGYPFLFVQLPNFKGSSWQWIREAQAFSLTYPNTGMAVSIDVGDHYDVHPHNKQPVGERLALQAEHIAYHEPLVYSGPTFDKLIITGNILTIKFKNIGKGLILKNTLQDSGFFIAGDDHVFYPVNTQLSGTSVILSSPLVEKPVAVRYAWDADPDVTLYNKEGLPAALFRTDDWKP